MGSRWGGEVMRKWIRFLPLIVVEKIAKSRCERLPLNDWKVVNPFDGVFFVIGDQYAKTKNLEAK